ncbi:hypothetical protein QBC37DRAFT_140687 [Rhypophila decipiens]|uniref:SRR1-like domain-containing protein n=1 Tax=Rhypophila decipiens TaxID=261697 RepID=A0AAN6Y9J6_9PEZI|nr:hypothetical protein QBC37DRAFT_140687 [Rhypophila decipiens]
MCTDPEDWTGLPAAWVARYQHHPEHISLWEEKMAKFNETIRKARQLYDSGVRWWTKEAIRDLDKQLERIRRSEPGQHEVTRTDLLGKQDKFLVSTGRSSRFVDESGREHFPQKPHIDYQTYETLCFIHHPFDMCFSPGLHTLRVGQYDQEVDPLTGQYVPPFPLYSLDELRLRFVEKKLAFEASQLWKDLVWGLDNSFSGIRIMRVRKIVVFATSTPSWNVEHLENNDADARPPNSDNSKVIADGEEIYVRNDTAIVQLSLGLLLRDYLTQYYSDEDQKTADPREQIKVYAQEPCFTENDKTVLGEHGFEVLEDPHGFLEMDEETAVVCFNADVPVRSLTAELARPAMMIWNKCEEESEHAHVPREEYMVRYGNRDVEGEEDEGVGDMEEEEEGEYCCQWTDPVTPRVMKMVREEYAEADFPDGPGYYRNFGPDPAIYVRLSPKTKTLNHSCQPLLS